MVFVGIEYFTVWAVMDKTKRARERGTSTHARVVEESLSCRLRPLSSVPSIETCWYIPKKPLHPTAIQITALTSPPSMTTSRQLAWPKTHLRHTTTHGIKLIKVKRNIIMNK
jgi:hypothetical protein